MTAGDIILGRKLTFLPFIPHVRGLTPIIMKLHTKTPHELRMCPIDFRVRTSKFKDTLHWLLSSDWEGKGPCAIVPLTWKIAHQRLCRVIRKGPLKISKSLKKAENGPLSKISSQSLLRTVYYPRATRCGGDIVTLLWFRPSVRPWFRPCVDLVNTIETTPMHISLSNLADMLTMTRGWTLLILEVRGQRSRSQWTYMEISLWTR